MCGIFGICNHRTGRPVDARELKRMGRLLSHRGPDWSAHWSDGPFGFGMVRLAIIGGEEANQPLWTRSGGLGIVFNGEIYNYRELNERYGIESTSDTRTLLELLAARGLACLEDLAGMFAMAVWDASERRLFLVRDRMGQKPLFLAETADGVAFASEVKALLAVDPRPRAASPVALSAFLGLGYLPEGLSPFQGIAPLAAGAWKEYAEGGTKEGTFWRLRRTAPSDPERFDALFAQAVQRRLVSDVPIGMFLSGGIDSNAVLSTALAVDGANVVRAYTILPEGDPGESALALDACNSHGLPLEMVPLGPQDVVAATDSIVHSADNLLANPPMYALHALSRRAGQEVKVVLGGGGGDELFYGYPTWKADWAFPLWSRVPGGLRRLVSAGAGLLPVRYGPHALSYVLEKFSSCPARERRAAHAWWRTLITGGELRDLNAAFADAWAEGYACAYDDAAREFPEFERQTAAADLAVWWRCMGLYMADVVPMGAGVEMRSPFMDHELVEWAINLPLDLAYHPLAGKRFLRRRLAGRLPAGILAGPKRPFHIPLGQWFRGDLREYVGDVLGAETQRRQGLLRPEAVGRIVDDHWRGRRDNSFKLLALLVLSRWVDLVRDRVWSHDA